MTSFAPPLAQNYRQGVWFDLDPLFRKCLTAAGILGLAFLVAVFLTPRKSVELTHVDQVPERFAKLILQETKPLPPPAITKPKIQDITQPDAIAKGPAPSAEGAAPKGPGTPEKPAGPLRTGPRDRPPGPGTGSGKGLGTGQAGRARAEAEVTQQLAAVTGSLNSVISEMATTLSAGNGDGDVPASRKPRRGAVRSGRSGAEIGTIPSGPEGGSPYASGSSKVQGTTLDIGVITLAGPGGGGGGGGSAGGGGGGGTGGSGGGGGGGRRGGGGGGEGGGDLRSNSSLLGVVRKYAAGIRFCYDNELKKDASLRGKLIVSITVAASGSVTDANVVENTLGSPALTSCALAQIRSWKFPQISEGVVTFQAPFVFTPPE